MGLSSLPVPEAGWQTHAPVDEHAMGRLVHRVLATLVPQQLEAERDALQPWIEEADVVIGNQLAYAAAMACKRTSKPWVYLAASPLAIPSRLDPPYWPVLHHLQRRTSSATIQRGSLQLARGATRLLMRGQPRMLHQSGAWGTEHPRFEGMYSTALNLLMASPLLVPAQSDWPNGTLATGFAWFDPPFLGGADQEEEITRFATAGDKPLVFAPGGSTRVDPGAFFVESRAATLALGRRAIIVAAKKFHAQFPPHPDILLTGYFPYARLFSHAAAVVHSAGIGALGWAARYAVPSLLVPSEWDQFDNARRAERSGWGHTLGRKHYTAERIAQAIGALESDQRVRHSLTQASGTLQTEDGARRAADAVEQLLQGASISE